MSNIRSVLTRNVLVFCRQKFNFRRKEGTKTLLEILYTAFAPNTLQQSECATKFLCQDCHE